MSIGRGTGALLIVLALTACDRKPDPKPVAPPPPTPPLPVSVDAVKPTPPEPIPAIFIIDDQNFTFPPAKLVLQSTDNGLRAALFSKDPPKVVEGRDTGNSFYFDMVLANATIEELPGKEFVYRNSAGEIEDRATTGIFIAGRKWRIQPLQATVAFDNVDGQTIAMVGGSFQLFEEAGNDPARTVTVRARLIPEVTEKK
jgi:hypothetical protein